jgi:hypothetical protein
MGQKYKGSVRHALIQYADDIVLSITHDPEKAINLKLLLCLVELMSGLKINYQKVRFSWLVGTILLPITTLLYLVAKWLPFL